MDAIYIGLSILSFGYLIASQRLLSPSFIFIIFLLIGGIIALANNAHYILALVCIILLMPISRYCFLAASEFVRLYRKIPTKEQACAIWLRSSLRILPFVALGAAVFYFSTSIEVWFNRTVLNNTVYDVSFHDDFGCLEDDIDDTLLVCTTDRSHSSNEELEKDLLTAIEDLRLKSKRHLKEAINKRLDAAEKASRQTQSGMVEVLFDANNAAVPARLWKINKSLKPPYCNGHYHWLTRTSSCLKKEILSPINSAYNSTRANTRADLLKTISKNQKLSGAQRKKIQKYLEAQLNQQIDSSADSSNAVVKRTMKNLRIISVIYLAITITYFVLLGFKTLLYILTRYIYSPRYGDVAFRLNADSADSQIDTGIKARDITNADNGFQIELGEQKWYMQHALISGFTRANVLQNQYAISRNPLPGILTIRRFFSGTLRLDEYRPEDLKLITGNGNINKRFVKIDLYEGQTLCLNLRSLVGFSQGIRLENRVGIIASIFMRHSLFFTVARGNGSILLLAEGGTAEILPDHDKPLAGYDPTEIIAFDAKGQFKFQSNDQLLGFYLRFPNFSASDNSLAIRHSKNEKNQFSYFVSIIKKVLFTVLPI